MNKRWKQALATGLMVLGLGMLVDRAEAGAGSSDTIIVNVTPNVTYAVQISSPMTNGYDFGQQALSATTLSTSGIGVLNTGNVSEFFSPSISNSSPGGWAPQSGAPSSDQYRMQALFTSANSEPASSGAGSWDNLTTATFSAAATHYGQGGFAKTPGGSSTTRYLWLYLTMPTDLITSAGAPQTMTLTINAQGS